MSLYITGIQSYNLWAQVGSRTRTTDPLRWHHQSLRPGLQTDWQFGIYASSPHLELLVQTYWGLSSAEARSGHAETHNAHRLLP
jgi:hypothetical protein